MRTAARLAGGALLALAALWSGGARADDGKGSAAAPPMGGAAAPAIGVTAASRPSIEPDLRGYYGGERLSAYIIGGMGLAAAAGGAYLVTRDGDFARGLGWSWIGMGGLEALAATFYAFQVAGEIDHYESSLARDPAAFRAEEIDHMRGTSSRFPYYRATELAFTLAGAGMAGYGFASNRDAWKGTGIGVASLALPLLLIDSLNDARAMRYRQNVEGFHPSVGVAPAALGQGMTVSLDGRF